MEIKMMSPISRNDKSPQISIILPVYNVEKYLPECLDSVLAQTFQDWEVICVNDGSPDNCGKILNEYAPKDSRIKIITQKNQGVSVARNNGLKLAKGDYVCFLDSDDELAPNFLEKMYLALNATKADIAWCDYQQGEYKQSWPEKAMPEVTYGEVFDRFICEHPNMGACIWNKMYRKEILKDCQFPEETGIGEDLVFLYKALFKAHEIIYVPMQLYFYRVRENSAMNSGLSEKIILGNIKAAELLIDYFKDKDLSLKTRKILNQKIAKRIFKFGVLEPKRKDKENLGKWYVLTRPLLTQLKTKGIYQPKYLALKNRLKAWQFLKGKQ